MKVKIVNCWTSRYRRSDQHFVPSLTLAHLAALTPHWCNVTLHHEQVRPVNVEQDVADGVQLAALSFPTGFALHAYRPPITRTEPSRIWSSVILSPGYTVNRLSASRWYTPTRS